DGLTDAAGLTDVNELLDGTRKRVFLLHDIHRKAPQLVETRWAMSYLRGPMTKDELSRVQGAAPASPGAPRATAPAPSSVAQSAAPADRGAIREAAVPAAAAFAAPPPAPSGWLERWVARRGADIAAPYLFVRYAVRYRLEGTSGGE